MTSIILTTDELSEIYNYDDETSLIQRLCDVAMIYEPSANAILYMRLNHDEDIVYISTWIDGNSNEERSFLANFAENIDLAGAIDRILDRDETIFAVHNNS